MHIVLLANAKSIHTQRWACGLEQRGHIVSVLTLPKHACKIEGFSGSILAMPHQGLAGFPLNSLFIRKWLRKASPDLLHGHYATSYGLLGRMAGFKPFVLSVWGSDVYIVPNRNRLAKQLVRRNLEAAQIVCSTSHDMGRITQQIADVQERLFITPFGIDTDHFMPLPRTRHEIIVGTVKGLDHVYGVDILIRAFRQVLSGVQSIEPQHRPAVKLRIVGDGTERERLIALVSELGISEYVEFAPRVANRFVPDELGKLDIYVAASRSESFGVAVLEASSCGLPVIVSRVGGLPEVVVDGVTGYCIETENVEAFADAILRMIRDDGLRLKMGVAGREFVEKTYTWARSLDIMEGVYRAAIRV
jgi:L-malate glycosyltransferase